MECRLFPLFFLTITKHGMPDFVSNEKSLLEQSPQVLMSDQRKGCVKRRTGTIEDRCARGALFNGNTQSLRHFCGELIRGPGIPTARDGFIV
ncbi:hypothetical protein PVE_R2G1020 [Pseudomonas veronii 1YdBTEX2]|uniref:Uncharacterized protein n=1 Tax=Pseudomonas veronii 1YdBTEX2 TaxID=1295141 RepID=A0A1D3K9X8_PSEVE|nr:hypothetical protein PVE_R2G1020 [Pseudomonas veronii 1YdBTEX2]